VSVRHRPGRAACARHSNNQCPIFRKRESRRVGPEQFRGRSFQL
jgi:hypothetical protein